MSDYEKLKKQNEKLREKVKVIERELKKQTKNNEIILKSLEELLQKYEQQRIR